MAVTAIPAELQKRPQWIVWRREERDGKPTKVPYRADGSGRASSTDRTSWSTFAVAAAAAQRFDGIGYVFAADDPFVGVDLDDGLAEADRGAIIAALDSYTETSVSGQGVHLIVRGSPNGHGRNRRGPFEVYEHGRYFVMTGRHVNGTPTSIEPRQAQLEDVLARYLPGAREERQPREPLAVDLDDQELLDRAMRARNGGDFSALWAGSWEGRFSSQSEADLALCSALAFWTGRDLDRIDRLFRSSGLMRDKWDRDDYRARTLAEAINGCRDVYTPPRPHGEEPPRSTEEQAGHAHSADAGPDEVARPFVGLTHDDVLQLDFPEERYLVDDVVPTGAVGTIAGVPETHKSWLALAIAVRVARGTGTILGREVTAQAAVGYFWQDDSTREEAERVKLFEQAHHNPARLPLRWFLNEGLTLPRDLSRLCATVDELSLGLIVLDSFYNFVPGIDLKDEGAEIVVAQIKREISDATGCTALLVDHMPWATDTNRTRLRAYGGVFKNAATRFGIYIDAQNKKLWIEARGNNVRGFKKRLAEWDDDTLELRLIETQEGPDAEAEAAALDWIVRYVEDHHRTTGTGVARGNVETAYHEAHGNHGRNLARRLIDREIRTDSDLATSPLDPENPMANGERSRVLATGPGEVKNGVYLYPASHASSPPAAPQNGEDGERPRDRHSETPLADLAAPCKGRERSGEEGATVASEPPDATVLAHLESRQEEMGL